MLLPAGSERMGKIASKGAPTNPSLKVQDDSLGSVRKVCMTQTPPDPPLTVVVKEMLLASTLATNAMPKKKTMARSRISPLLIDANRLPPKSGEFKILESVICVDGLLFLARFQQKCEAPDAGFLSSLAGPLRLIGFLDVQHRIHVKALMSAQEDRKHARYSLPDSCPTDSRRRRLLRRTTLCVSGTVDGIPH